MKRIKNRAPQTVFIVGSPRSGTTILENILNCHPDIAEWYEPYYLWETYFPCPEDDIWHEEYLTEKAVGRIREAFGAFGKKANKPMVLDKSPTHSFNMDIIRKVFPNAKWIHILRDGRDVTLSIRREWLKRKEIVRNRDFKGLIRVAADMLRRQRFWRYRLMAIAYELRSTLALNPLMYLNKSRWKGEIGWGPRFKGWEEYLRGHSSLQFNAMQWVKSVEAVKKSWPVLPEINRLEIRYEELLTHPEKTLTKVLDILGIGASNDFFDRIPTLKKGNFDKWGREFSSREMEEIRPILDPLLSNLGYVEQGRW